MEIIQELPHSDEAEQYLIGSLINMPDLLDEIRSLLKAEDFYKSCNQKLFSLLTKLSSEDIEIDLVTVLEYAKSNIENYGNITYITEIVTATSYCTKENAKEYAKIIQDKSQRRSLIKLGRDLMTKSYDEGVSLVIEKAEEKIYSIVSSKESSEFVSIGQALNESLNKLEERYSNGGGIIGVTTGYKELDNTISGLVKGDFMVIAARPSMGKTAFALNIGQYASKSSNVAIFSLEMSREQLMDRLLSAKCLVDYNAIKLGDLTESEFTKIADGSNDLSKRSIWIDDETTNLNGIIAKCKYLKNTKGLDVVIIDYLQLIELSKAKQSREQDVSYISRELKKLAKKFEVTVIALSQLSRAPEQRADHRPMMSDLRESGAIEQDADEVMFLYRDDYYNKESEDRGMAEVIIGKNRNGPTKTIKLAWVGNYQKFAPLEIVGGN